LSVRTTDLCDAHGDAVRVAAPGFRDFGGLHAFHGPVLPVTVFEDNTSVRDALQQAGEGRVLVVDGGGSLRCALLGGNLAELAQDNGWAGVIVHGCVRDVLEIAACRLGVKALAVNPRRSEKRGPGQVGEPVRFAGIEIASGDWLHADEDGFIVADRALT